MAEQDEETRPRAFWSGTITFGLVSIPVELFPANRSQRVSLRMTAPDGTPLSRRYVCPKENRILDWDEIVRGYEIEKDRFVVVTDDELDKLAPERTRDIDLRRFVPAASIDPAYFERAYFLTPGGNSTKAYRLLAATMEQTERAGIATFVMRGKEYLIAILAENGILRAETLRFAEEVRTHADVGLPEPEKPKAAVVKKYEKAIAALKEGDLDEADLVDTGSERLLELVARKEKSGEDVIDAPETAVEPSEGVIDLMEVLKRSLRGRAADDDAAKKSPARKRASSTAKTATKGAKKAAPKTTDKTAKKSGSKTARKAAKKSARKAAKKAAKKAPARSAKKAVKKARKSA